jgi:hypothetical protein
MDIAEWVMLIAVALGTFFGAIIGYKLTIRNGKEEDGAWIIFGASSGAFLGGIVGLGLACIGLYIPLVLAAIIAAAIVIAKMEKTRKANIAIAEAEKKKLEDQAILEQAEKDNLRWR